MRFLTLGSAALLLAACSGGKDSGVDCTVTPDDPACQTDPPGPTGPTGAPDPECLDINVLTMDMEFGWDGGATVAVGDGQGGTVPSFFRMNFGPPNWQGDTSGPPQPDNWCFIEWPMDGIADSSAGGGEFAIVSGLATGISNCGQESSPGAGDMVTLCDPNFFYGGDPSAAYASPDWTFASGPAAIDSELQDFPGYFTPYGYVEENFFGGLLTNEPVFGPDGVAAVVFGIKVDANGDLIYDPTTYEFERHVVTDQGPGALQPGYYSFVLPWIFTFQ